MNITRLESLSIDERQYEANKTLVWKLIRNGVDVLLDGFESIEYLFGDDQDSFT